MTAASVSSDRDTVSLKGRDAWWTVFAIDPLAAPAALRLSRLRWVTPNRITAVSATVGILAGVAFALGWLVVGALLFQVAFLFDCMDGKIAAIRGTKDPWGGFYDVVGDTLRFVSCAIGLVYHLAADGPLSVGATAAVAVYLAARGATMLLDEARPVGRGSVAVEVTARPLPVLRSAPHRLAKLGATVDGEAVVFTIAPLAAAPVAGLAVGAATAGLNFVYSIARAVRLSRSPG